MAPTVFNTDSYIVNYSNYCAESASATWDWLVNDLYNPETPNVRECAQYVADLLWNSVWLAFAGEYKSEKSCVEETLCVAVDLLFHLCVVQLCVDCKTS